MALDIRLINDIHAEFIAQIVKNSVIWVVRATNRDYVMASHYF